MALQQNILIEVVVFALAAGCFYSTRERLDRLAVLLVAMSFGLLVEAYFIFFAEGYSYGVFLGSIPVGEESVPIWVAVGWGTIIFTAVEAVDRMGLKGPSASVVAALLALSVDLTLDPIAHHEGWWTWARKPHYYGVPYDNFIGWLMIVGFFSGFTRRTQQHLGGWLQVFGAPLLGLMGSIAAIIGCTYVLENWVYPTVGEPLSFFALASVLVAYAYRPMRDARPTTPAPWYVVGVPGVMHLLMTLYMLLEELYEPHPELLVLFPVTTILSLAAFGGRAPEEA